MPWFLDEIGVISGLEPNTKLMKERLCFELLFGNKYSLLRLSVQVHLRQTRDVCSQYSTLTYATFFCLGTLFR